jgi:Sec-independent protein translocase protein TatA
MLLLRLLLCGLHLQFMLAFLVQPETARVVVKDGIRGDAVPLTPLTIYKPCVGTGRISGRFQTRIIPQSRIGVNTQLMGLFGLGGLEIAVICIGIAVVLGPQKIASMIRATGETAGEFKNELSKVPDEFQKGYEEGQIEARSRKAKPITTDEEKRESIDINETK